jgi:nucleotide-binding universal stress UspA family protein
MYQRILVPLDGSAFSESVLDHVKAIAAGCAAPVLLLLTVIEPYRGQVSRVDDNLPLKMENEAETAAMKYLDSLAIKLKSQGFNPQAVVARGSPAEAILNYIEKNQIDLVIMSTHCRAGVSRLILGSVANRVVSYSSAPVVLVPPTSRVASGSPVLKETTGQGGRSV